MKGNTQFTIAVVAGDGIGPEVIGAAREILDAAQSRVGGFALQYQDLPAGAGHYRETGDDMPQEAFDAAGKAHAIFLGAIGLPSVRYPDGTEISPHLRMRDTFGLYAGVRPAKAYPNIPPKLADPRAAEIDLVVLRESTEGLFYSHGRGEVIGAVRSRFVIVG